jgi:hypothetical protein
MGAKKHIWETKPAEEDFKAARTYLGLLADDAVAANIVKRLRAAKTSEFEAKDLLRASQTHLLDDDDPHVAENLKKLKKGKRLSPVLLVRGDAFKGVTLTIADGHHRICASYQWSVEEPVACRIVSWPG